jgi:AcrR family transcriptional regulator
MLNMSSAELDVATDERTDPDRTSRARIRDAAIERFADHGVDGTSVRGIAAAAGVSPGLVIHHFGSKDALRVACDQHVAALIRERKRAAMGAGGMDPLGSLRAAEAGPPLLRYLARTLVDGSPHVAELVDELVADAEEYMAEGVANGLLEPSDDPRGRSAVLTIWSLGALVLHEHLHRLLGADLTGDPAGLGPYAVPAAELLTHGVLRPTLYEQVRATFAGADDRPQREVRP